MYRSIRVFLVGLLATLALSACGGGSSPPPTPTQQQPPPVDTQLDWDQGNWDEENWQ